MRRFIPHVLWVFGLALLLAAAGKGSGAGLPYPDPTPELLAVQRGQEQMATALALTGGVFLVAGIVWIIARRLRQLPVVS
jgi:hypothetical protein